MTHTLPLTINGEVRQIEVRQVNENENRLDSVRSVAIFRKNGGKAWPGTVTFWKKSNGEWVASRSGVFLSRSGYTISGWNDNGGANRSNHNSASL